MILKSFGCSFIFGTELSDDGCNGIPVAGSKLTWPALLAKEFGYNYWTYSRPGSGNLQIAERVLCQLAQDEPSLYVIGWTWIDRFDYIDELHNQSINPLYVWPGTPWSTIMPDADSAVAETYYKRLHSEYRDKLTTLLYVKLVIDTLKQKNVPFIMTYMDSLMFSNKWHNSPATLELQQYIQPYMTDFNGLSFLEWSRAHDYPIGAGQHPLDDAHDAAAKYLLELGVHKI